jgi:hypothetical protein
MSNLNLFIGQMHRSWISLAIDTNTQMVDETKSYTTVYPGLGGVSVTTFACTKKE